MSLSANIRHYTHSPETPIIPAESIVLLGSCTDTRIAQAVRQELYALMSPVAEGVCTIADMGDLPMCATTEGACEQLAAAMQPLLAAGKLVLIIGDDAALQFGQFAAYEGIVAQTHVADISARFSAERVLRYHPTHLFDYALLGYQRYFVAEESLIALRERHFAALRYGDLADDLREAEPFLRDAHMAHFSLSSIRRTDAPATQQPSVGGFSAMEACRLARYAGMSPNISSFFCSDIAADTTTQTPQLVALLLWYMIEGYYHRQYDHPNTGGAHFQKYAVTLTIMDAPLMFYCNTATERWWVEIPASSGKPSSWAACSERDFRLARENNLPERWWAMVNK